MLRPRNISGVVIPGLLVGVLAFALKGLAAEPEPVADHGWTSPWQPSGAGVNREHVVVQNEVKATGDMALASTGPVGFFRRFPDVSSGVIKIEFRVRFRYPTVEVNHPDSSVVKVYLYNKDAHHSFAWRWHTPYAWPRAGGNTMPRFYVGKSGLGYTNFGIQPHTWYKVTTISNLDDLTWQFLVDDVPFDPAAYHGRGPLRMSRTGKVNALQISARTGGMWFDAFRIWHNDELIAACDFNEADGYVPGASAIDLPAQTEASRNDAEQ